MKQKIESTDKEMLTGLQKETFEYFRQETDPETGLCRDHDDPNSPASISVTGMALTSYIVAAENNFITRQEAINYTLKVLRFFYNSTQSRAADATGFKGFYYHFLDVHTGKRAWNSELSTIDTALLLAGVLSAAAYFTLNQKDEKEIRHLADELYRRVDWQWALNRKNTLTHGWKPGRGFLRYRWDEGYSEAHILYILALGSPTFPISTSGYQQWIATFNLSNNYDIEYLYAGPLFIHQFSHIWIDFRGIRDAFNQAAGIDYFENSKRATKVQQAYAIENPMGIALYGEKCWGLTASDGPGRKVLNIKGKKKQFYGYKARGAPYGPDDGTISPWAMVACLPFEPGIVIPSIHYAIEHLHLKPGKRYGFDVSFNPLYPGKTGNQFGWISPNIFGLNQAPIIMMIENYQTELIWTLMKRCPYIKEGLSRAGFNGGWLNEKIP